MFNKIPIQKFSKVKRSKLSRGRLSEVMKALRSEEFNHVKAANEDGLPVAVSRDGYVCILKPFVHKTKTDAIKEASTWTDPQSQKGSYFRKHYNIAFRFVSSDVVEDDGEKFKGKKWILPDTFRSSGSLVQTI